MFQELQFVYDCYIFGFLELTNKVCRKKNKNVSSHGMCLLFYFSWHHLLWDNLRIVYYYGYEVCFHYYFQCLLFFILFIAKFLHSWFNVYDWVIRLYLCFDQCFSETASLSFYCVIDYIFANRDSFFVCTISCMLFGSCSL